MTGNKLRERESDMQQRAPRLGLKLGATAARKKPPLPTELTKLPNQTFLVTLSGSATFKGLKIFLWNILVSVHKPIKERKFPLFMFTNQ